MRLIIKPPSYALAVRNVGLRLCHFKSAAVLGGVVKLNLVQDSTRLFRLEYAVEACSIVGVTVVLHQPELLDSRVKLVYPIGDVADVLSPGASFGHRGKVPASRVFTHPELAADSLPLVLLLGTYRRRRTGQFKWPHVTEQLFVRCAQADCRPLQISGEHFGLNNILHPPNKFRFGPRRDAP